MLVDRIAWFRTECEQGARYGSVISATDDHTRTCERVRSSGEDAAGDCKELYWGVQVLQGQQSSGELNTFIARIVEIATTDDAQTWLQVDHFVFLIVMDSEPEIAVCDD